jgi:hypothetical protein
MHTNVYDYLLIIFRMPSTDGSLGCHYTKPHNKSPHDRHVFTLHYTSKINISDVA